MTLYDTIFIRRSVRKYDCTPLNAETLTDIQSVIDSAEQLSGQSARFTIVSADALKGAASPYAILAHSENTDAALCNLGYAGQTLDLYLQSQGLGSLWMGMAKPTNPEPDYRILIAFGKTEQPVRNGERDFKRRSVLDVSNADNPIARAARLAPSAVNFQPWKIKFAPKKVILQYTPKGIVKLLAPQFQKIDLGICLRHIELALKHEGKTVTSITPAGSGKNFVVTIEYNN